MGVKDGACNQDGPLARREWSGSGRAARARNALNDAAPCGRMSEEVGGETLFL